MVNLRVPMYIFILWWLAFVSATPIDPGDDPGDFLKDSLDPEEGKKLVCFSLKRFNDQNILFQFSVQKYLIKRYVFR